MGSNLDRRLAKLETRIAPHQPQMFVCYDEDIEAFKAANSVGADDILITVTFTDDRKAERG